MTRLLIFLIALVGCGSPHVYDIPAEWYCDPQPTPPITDSCWSATPELACQRVGLDYAPRYIPRVEDDIYGEPQCAVCVSGQGCYAHADVPGGAVWCVTSCDECAANGAVCYNR